MNMYNMVHGYNPLVGILLGVLEVKPDDFGRFRDAYLIKREGELQIAVFTRCGGGNRADYEDVFEEAREHPLYVEDYDDDFDSTYAYIIFKIPVTPAGQGLIEAIEDLPEDQKAIAIQTKSLKERTDDAINSMKDSFTKEPKNV